MAEGSSTSSERCQSDRSSLEGDRCWSCLDHDLPQKGKRCSRIVLAELGEIVLGARSRARFCARRIALPSKDGALSPTGERLAALLRPGGWRASRSSTDPLR